jgi:Skp family chaperone for outer membrane proteins
MITGIFLLTVIGCKAEPPKFGVVDVIKVVDNSKAGKKLNAELETLINVKRAELNQKGEALKKSLKEPGSKVKPDDINKANAEYQKLAAAAEAEVKKKATELRKTMFEQIKKIIEGIGQEENFVMIFTTDNIPYYQATMDVTDKVIQKYDEAAGLSGQKEAPANK